MNFLQTAEQNQQCVKQDAFQATSKDVWDQKYLSSQTVA